MLEGHDEEKEEEIFKKYALISKEKKNLCKDCNGTIEKHNLKKLNDGKPVSFFSIGIDFDKTNPRLMFVGKVVTRNWGKNEKDPSKSDPEKSGFIDARPYSKTLFYEKGNKFFEGIRTLCGFLWSKDIELIRRRIAVSDIIKCSVSENTDETIDEMKEKCLEAGFLMAEIQIAKPTHLIFLTGPKYDNQIKTLMNLRNEMTNVPENDIDIWFTDEAVMNGNKINVLRTYHPNYIFLYNPKMIDPFCKRFVKWVTETSCPSLE